MLESLCVSLTDSLKHTNMAVTIDIGDADDIHHKNKMELGRRFIIMF